MHCATAMAAGADEISMVLKCTEIRPAFFLVCEIRLDLLQPILLKLNEESVTTNR